jgi:hypothetical protein
MRSHPAIQILSSFDWNPELERCLVVSCSRCPPLPGAVSARLTWRCDVQSAAQLEDLERFPVALVIDQIPHMPAQSAVHMLAQLRDRYAERIIVSNEEETLDSQQLLALGFIRREVEPTCGNIYLHDPAEFYERRAWNDSRDWANPENFNRFRW